MFPASRPPPHAHLHHLHQLLLLTTRIFFLSKNSMFLSVWLQLMEWVMRRMLPVLQLHYWASARGMGAILEQERARALWLSKKLLSASGEITQWVHSTPVHRLTPCQGNKWGLRFNTRVYEQFWKVSKAKTHSVFTFPEASFRDD